MDNQQEQLETLKEIRSLMDRSSRFLSLSGLSGIIAGIAAIAGIIAFYMHLGISAGDVWYTRFMSGEYGELQSSYYSFLVTDALIVLVVAVLASSLLTMRSARSQGQPIWDATAKRLLVNLLIPLVAGGIFCLSLLYNSQIAFIPSAALLFYGLALLNAGKYTLNDVRYLGIIQIITGLIASTVIEYGLLFWAFGFGVVHIAYGITMYIKYGK